MKWLKQIPYVNLATAVHTRAGGWELGLESDGEGKPQPVSIRTQELNYDDAGSPTHSYFSVKNKKDQWWELKSDKGVISGEDWSSKKNSKRQF